MGCGICVSRCEREGGVKNCIFFVLISFSQTSGSGDSGNYSPMHTDVWED